MIRKVAFFPDPFYKVNLWGSGTTRAPTRSRSEPIAMVFVVVAWCSPTTSRRTDSNALGTAMTRFKLLIDHLTGIFVVTGHAAFLTNIKIFLSHILCYTSCYVGHNNTLIAYF